MQLDAKLLLSIRDAAALLSVSRRKVEQLLASGVIQSLKIDRCRRIARSEIDRFIRCKQLEFYAGR